MFDREYMDVESRRPSRCYLVQLLINFGANPNHTAGMSEYSPLHWLAFWGDHRAVRIMLVLNREDLLKVPAEERAAYLK